jgi:tetratricopeptide (TPR) repeat protein
LNELANSYSLSGQPKKAVPLLKRQIETREKLGQKNNVAIGLLNLALDQIRLGEFESAESNLRLSIDLCLEIRHEVWEAVGHQDLGRLLAYRGEFEKSEKAMEKGLGVLTKEHELQLQGLGWSYCAIRAILMLDGEEALKVAKRARELADVEHYERDIIQAEWLLGATYLAKGDLKEAEAHLNEALARDRRINLVELEPDILLELAKLRFKQGHKEDALKLAKEASGIADRSEYRLKQADIHNFLAEFYLDAKNFSKAKEHVEIAKEWAECGYQPAMKKAEELLKRISQQIKQM